MTLDLDALEALAAAATPGPWRYIEAQKELVDPDENDVVGVLWYVDEPPRLHLLDGDALFIAAARDALPQLIAELRQLYAYHAARQDDPQWDGTDAAHPAWWRGQKRGAQGAVDVVRRALRGEDGGTPASAGLAEVVAEVRRLRERLALRDAQEQARLDDAHAQALRALAGHTAPPAVVLKTAEFERLGSELACARADLMAARAERDSLRRLLGTVYALADGRGCSCDQIASKCALADIEPHPDEPDALDVARANERRITETHWLHVAAKRVIAGESELQVMRDCGYVPAKGGG